MNSHPMEKCIFMQFLTCKKHELLNRIDK
jgi:hypothetical protein